MNTEHVALVRQGSERIAEWRAKHPGEVLNLSGADLSGAYLAGANLVNADLTNANLTGADLTDADLHGAKVRGAGFADSKVSEEKLDAAAAKYGSGLTVGFDQLFVAILGALMIFVWATGRPYKFQLIWGVSLFIIAAFWELDRRRDFRRCNFGTLLAGGYSRCLFIVIEKAEIVPRLLWHVLVFGALAPAAVVILAHSEASERGWLRRGWSALTKNRLRRAATYLGLALFAAGVFMFVFKYPLVRPYTPRPLRWLSLTESRFLEYRARIEDGYQAFETALDECEKPERCQTEAALDFFDVIMWCVSGGVYDYQWPCLSPEWMRDAHSGISVATRGLATDSLFRDIAYESDRKSASEWAQRVVWRLQPYKEFMDHLFSLAYENRADVNARAEEHVDTFFGWADSSSTWTVDFLAPWSLERVRQKMDDWRAAAAR